MAKKSKAGKFILGAAVGAALGVLFAPKTGKETRQALKKKADELLEKAKEIDVQEVRETVENKTKEIMDEIKTMDKEKAIKIAKKQGTALKKKADELVEYTKKKATPVVNEAAEALREKAVEVTKKVLDKLEQE